MPRAFSRNAPRTSSRCGFHDERGAVVRSYPNGATRSPSLTDVRRRSRAALSALSDQIRNGVQLQTPWIQAAINLHMLICSSAAKPTY